MRLAKAQTRRNATTYSRRDRELPERLLMPEPLTRVVSKGPRASHHSLRSIARLMRKAASVHTAPDNKYSDTAPKP